MAALFIADTFLTTFAHGEHERSLHDSSLYDMIYGETGERQTEGNLASVACLDENNALCERCDSCETLEVWQKLHDAINQVVDGITLADLVTRHKEIIQRMDDRI